MTSDVYKNHLNFDDLRKSTERLEMLLNKYRSESKEAEAVYKILEPLLNKIKANQLKEPVEDSFRSSGYYIYETPIAELYPDLREAYSTFCIDVKGMREGPINTKIRETIRLALEAARAKRDAEQGK
ncbi:hypothetical protein [Commensalibacter intestini]|nr:hypothetical protein [Commensalibacter intestini]